MRIGITSALQDEVAHLASRLERPEESTALQRRLFAGSLFDTPSVVVGSGVGKVRASACTQFLIDRYAIDAVITFGLAGALHKDLKVGDVVISKQAIIHDYFVAGKGVAEDIGIRPIEADPTLIDIALKASAEVAPANEIHIGTVLTGDEAVADTNRRSTLRETFGGDCVEMEGAAVGLVCALNRIPFVIVRGISDLADESAHTQFEDTFEQVVGRLSQIVIHMVRLISRTATPNAALTVGPR
jgi:adenosylhomocysteine nucleosidase